MRRRLAAGGVLTLALVDSGEQQPILVGARDSDDDDDVGNFEGGYEGAMGPREVEMKNNPRKPTSGGGTLAAKIGRRMAANGSSNGNGHGGVNGANGAAVEVGGAHLSPGPSQGRSPIKSKKKGAGMMGMYARVGGGDVDGGGGGQGRQYGIMFEESSARNRQASDGGGGFSEDEENQTLRLGRTAEVEGQMEAGRGGSRWDADSDSSGDDYAGTTSSDLVQPA